MTTLDQPIKEEEIDLTIHYLGDKKVIRFLRTCIVSEALKQICAYHPVDRIEACGLCFVDPENKGEKHKKSKFKDGAYRDTTDWLDANHSFQFYVEKGKLSDNGELILKVKNRHLNKSQKVRVLIISQGNAEIEVKYDYLTTVKNVIDRLLHIEDADDVVSESWALLLLIGRIEGKVISLWLDPTRTCSSYSLQNPNEEDTTLRLLVLTQNPKELQKLKVPLKENELEMWWLYQMQRNKWSDFSPEVNYSKFEKLKSQVRKGIPGPLRGDIWFIITGARELREPGKYEEYLEQEPNEEDLKRIERDLHRTLPFHPYFQDEVGKNQLCKVLVAVTNHLGKRSYCQGMNYIMGILLLTMNEECAFWTFLALMKSYSMRLFFEDNVPLLSTSLMQFEKCIQEMYPELYDHLVAQDIMMNTFATSWFLTLFSQQGQLEFVQQLWDIFFNEGFSIIFRVAIALLGEARDLAMEMDMEELKNYFQSAPAQITNPEIILNAAFKVEKNKYMLKIYNEQELETLEKGGKEAKKLKLSKEESRLISGMYTTKDYEQKIDNNNIKNKDFGTKASSAYMSSVVGSQTSADRIRDNNVSVLTAVNKTYDASSMSIRGRLMEMKGPMGHALATQKNEKLGKSDTQQSDSGEEKKEDLVIKKEPQPAEFIDLSKPKQPKEATKVLKDSTQSTPRKKTTKDTYAPDGTSKSKKSRDGLRSPRERPASERLPKVDMKGIVEESAPLEKSNSKTLANKKNPSMSSPRKGNEELRGSVKISKVEEKLNAEPKGNEEKKKHTKSADPESKPEKNNNSGEHHHHHHHHNEDKEEVKSKSHKHHAEETKKETTDEAEANRYMQRKKAKKNPSIPEDKSTSSGLSNDLKQSDQNASNNNS